MSDGDATLVSMSLSDAGSPLERTKTQVTVRFLIEIHNLAPVGSEIRTKVENAITQAAQLDNKAHWARGLIQTATGELAFDDARYLHAVYQGKQDTYAQSAQLAFDELQRSLERVTANQNAERISFEEMASTTMVGRPLVELTTPTHPAALLKAAASSLPNFVARMAGGMDVALGGSVPETLTKK
jgi:hypothetical protein